jgi:hypothetical protein
MTDEKSKEQRKVTDLSSEELGLLVIEQSGILSQCQSQAVKSQEIIRAVQSELHKRSESPSED